MWLANVWAQLVSNLEEMQRRYKENVDEHKKEQPNFKVRDQVWFRQQHIKTTRPSKKLDHQKVKSIPQCEINQCCGFPTQASRLYENPSYVSCFFIGTLPRVYYSIFMIHLHLLKSMVNMNMKWKTFKILGSLIVISNILFIGMGMMWMNVVGNQSRSSNAIEKVHEFHRRYPNKSKSIPYGIHC
jgi:hypothetical protein